MIIDFHTHTFPDKVAPNAIAHMQNLNHSKAYSDGTVSGLIDSAKRAQIDYSVVLPVVTNPTKAASINNVSIAHTADDGLIYFGGMHPDTPDWFEELGRIAAAGIQGIKLHPQYQAADIDDIRYLRILTRAAELGLIVVIHAGCEPAYPQDQRSTPKMIRNTLDQVGPVKLVAAHMGGLWNWEEAAELLAGTGIYIDTSNSLGRITQTEENFYTENQLQLMDETQFCKMVRTFGADRVLFGSDSPWTSQLESISAINALALTQEEKDLIFFQNACRLLNIRK